jgi:hypothetical protein
MEEKQMYMKLLCAFASSWQKLSDSINNFLFLIDLNPEINMKNLSIKLRLTFIALTCLLAISSYGQPVVGLDNWFNNEVNAKTKKPFHYLWTDTENSAKSGGDIWKPLLRVFRKLRGSSDCSLFSYI